jgi:hypothetical protein
MSSIGLTLRERTIFGEQGRRRRHLGPAHAPSRRVQHPRTVMATARTQRPRDRHHQPRPLTSPRRPAPEHQPRISLSVEHGFSRAHTPSTSSRCCARAARSCGTRRAPAIGRAVPRAQVVEVAVAVEIADDEAVAPVRPAPDPRRQGVAGVPVLHRPVTRLDVEEERRVLEPVGIEVAHEDPVVLGQRQSPCNRR